MAKQQAAAAPTMTLNKESIQSWLEAHGFTEAEVKSGLANVIPVLKAVAAVHPSRIYDAAIALLEAILTPHTA